MVRAATEEDIAAIEDVVEAARGIMRGSGNKDQWINGYPGREVIEGDIRSGAGFVLEDAGRVAGYFAFIASPEPTYARIYSGQWLDDSQPYHVIHRIASYPDVKGVFSSLLDFSLAVDGNIRIDTHRDNKIMQHLLQKHGFSYCGIIYLLSSDERLAYQLISRRCSA